MSARRPVTWLAAVLTFATIATPTAVTAEPVRIGSFAIDATEVSVASFEAYAKARALRTAAEREGGGFEFRMGWVRRSGWSYLRPSGDPAAPEAPAAHVSWSEARDFCAAAGGRLPTAAEWREAAYTERRETPSDGFETGRTYAYAVGDKPDGMNLSSGDRWERHSPVGATRRGVNGLFDMGGNVWEWLSDRRGEEALTAGGSWWYGPAQSRADGMQWKAANFYAVYVGFRCAYDVR